MYWLIGLDAIETPATKAPISGDSRISEASSASPRHQPMASRKMYSWKRSKRWISRISTRRTSATATITSTGSAINAASSAPGSKSPYRLPISATSTRIAIMSCSSSKPTISSPVWRWCNTVVGSSLMPMIVLENIIAMPVISASARVKPAAAAAAAPTSAKHSELVSATTVELRMVVSSARGCISSPSRNSRKMIPMCAISCNIVRLVISPRP